jgi:hypothetical protein
VNTEALAAFATKDAARRAAAPKWRPPESSDFHLPPLPRARWIIGVDQSLSACGAVLIGGGRSKDGSPVFSVEQAWKIVTDAPDDKGFEASLRRATELSKRFRDFLVHAWLHGVDGVLELAHETPPPLRVSRIRSPESSLLASLALRIAADVSTGVVLGDMVTAQNHKQLICGNRLAEKAEHHAALKQLGVDLGIENFDLIKNEATRDALSIALMQFTRPPLEIR